MTDPIKIAKGRWERTVLKAWVKEHAESRKGFVPPSGSTGCYLERQVYGSCRDAARF